jgi:hypothetical protein
MAALPTPALPDGVLTVLQPLAALPGVLWCGLLDRQRAQLHWLPAPGNETPFVPQDVTVFQVLTDAILTASSALGAQFHQGPASDLAFSFQAAGLLLVMTADPQCALLLAHTPGPGTPVLRLAVRTAAERFTRSPAPATPAPPQSGVYNPFTSA